MNGAGEIFAHAIALDGIADQRAVAACGCNLQDPDLVAIDHCGQQLVVLAEAKAVSARSCTEHLTAGSGIPKSQCAVPTRAGEQIASMVISELDAFALVPFQSGDCLSSRHVPDVDDPVDAIHCQRISVGVPGDHPSSSGLGQLGEHVSRVEVADLDTGSAANRQLAIPGMKCQHPSARTRLDFLDFPAGGQIVQANVIVLQR